jgi:hypothetical protein
MRLNTEYSQYILYLLFGLFCMVYVIGSNDCVLHFKIKIGSISEPAEIKEQLTNSVTTVHRC